MGIATHRAGPTDNRNSARTVLHTLPFGTVQFTAGFWARGQQINRTVSIAHGYTMLEKAGNFRNLRIAAGLETGAFTGRNFYDEDVYKWLEALGWELANAPDAALQAMADEAINLIAAAQMADGYLNSYYQVAEPEAKWSDMDHGHELFCVGHLIQAALAFARALHDERLLKVVLRFVDHIYARFGPGQSDATDGHPGIEMALVELYRYTGDPRHLELAELFIDRRGRNRMRGHAGYGAEYHQDHVPVRMADEVTGHAVRQLYLAAGATDLYMETGDVALLEAMHRLWQDMTTRKIYLTGGVGSRFDGEGFGAPYELPGDTCYCETCAAIGSLLWNWRLLLITGESRYADLFERTLYNAVLASPGLAGNCFLYANPLHVRDGRYVRASTDVMSGAEEKRPAWHYVACCPPNVMRLWASLGHYLATTAASGVQIHQYANARIAAQVDGRPVVLDMTTDYPWDGRIALRVTETPNAPWALALRHPAWCSTAALRVNGAAVDIAPDERGYWLLHRAWQPGDTVELDLTMSPRRVEPNPRIDALRGCAALERGPLVYCFEQHDQPDGIAFADLRLDASTDLQVQAAPALLGGIVCIQASGRVLGMAQWQNTLYRPIDGASPTTAAQRVMLTAIPYYAWGNRGMASMRVWMPLA
jgi:DUF1680 family protein